MDQPGQIGDNIAGSSSANSLPAQDSAALSLINEYVAAHRDQLFAHGTLTQAQVQSLEQQASPVSDDYRVLSFLDQNYSKLLLLGETPAPPSATFTWNPAADSNADPDPMVIPTALTPTVLSDLRYADASAAQQQAAAENSKEWNGEKDLALKEIPLCIAATAQAYRLWGQWGAVATGGSLGLLIALGFGGGALGRKDTSNYYDQKHDRALALLGNFPQTQSGTLPSLDDLLNP